LLELYNEATRQVARQAGALAIDVAKEMPKDSRYFSDWVHFTNDGAVVLGDLVYRGLEPRLKAGH
jgi:lysophospholipase L1-like esterase